MKSIRFFLVVVLLASMTLIIFLSALHGYQSSMVEVKALLDEEIANRARLLGIAGGSQTPDIAVVRVSEANAFQVWHDERLIQRSDNTPLTPIATEAGFQDRNFSGYRWRTYSWIGDDGYRAITAERIDVRNALAEGIIMKSVLPVIIALPLAGILIWFIVGYGLSPLRSLANHLQRRRADDLRPIPMDRLPVELMQVVSSANELLHRLDASFARERQFASDAAHELRTPICALKVHLHNIRQNLPDGDDELAYLVAATDRMDNLVEQILLLYRTSPDHYATQLKELDLHALVQEVITGMYAGFEQRRIQLELEGGTEKLVGDHFALGTLVKNLLDNACKYTPEGGQVRVTVGKHRGGIMLRVEDSGPGIPADQYQRVFDRFYRVNGDQHASDVIGCGLGLAIVKHITELHGATIEAGPSSFDNGLSMTLIFPRRVIRNDMQGINDE
ncbi:MAG: sensor histidine kinase [Gammaproteobacteria bacterium]|nr:MAG: sensor histidine kinase [Gammaproteobacteria bacterium]